MKITVIIPTHNPHPGRLAQTLEGLRRQSLCASQWELLIIDNASADAGYFAAIDLKWHPHARVVREEKLGLTAARLRGFAEAAAPYIVMVDDDNILAHEYLENVLEILDPDPSIGAVGGKSIPLFEKEPEPWVRRFYHSLALRDLGDEPIISPAKQNSKFYPKCAPIGAGMALRTDAARIYAAELASRDKVIMDRTGNNLTSGGDNDLVLTIMKHGWRVAYYPQLSLQHIIPPGRCTKEYLARLNRCSSESWVQVLDIHGIRMWPKLSRWLLIPLQWRAYFRVKAWQAPEKYVEWQNRCGLLAGRTKLT